MTTRATPNGRAPILIALLMMSAPGCATVSLLNLQTAKIPTADAQHPAIEILAIWQAAEGPGPKGVPVRGFAGQIFFFTQDRASPVAVDGTARIYLFDDHGTVQEQVHPLHQYDFDRESWRAHLQMPKIGPTYGVFIPYPRNDYHQTVCSLRVRFTPSTKGMPLYSPSSTIVLPGPAHKTENETAQPSPIRELAKKLQEQQQLAQGWKTANIDTSPKPFGAGPQSVTSPMAAPGQPGAENVAAVYSMPQRPQTTGAGAIVQTSGTVRLSNTDSMAESSDAPSGVGDSQPLDAAGSSRRFTLQAANAEAGDSGNPAPAGGNGAMNGLLRAEGAAPAPLAHPGHPLSD